MNSISHDEIGETKNAIQATGILWNQSLISVRTPSRPRKISSIAFETENVGVHPEAGDEALGHVREDAMEIADMDFGVRQAGRNPSQARSNQLAVGR